MYLINDIIDLESDKQHPIKRLRPLVAGKITALQARVTAFVFGSGAVLFSFIVDVHEGWVIVCYVLLNIVYMKVLKRIILIDIICIAAFFYLRIMAGALASDVVLSSWIILRSMLLVLVLGLIKRRSETKLFNKQVVAKEKYNVSFLDEIILVMSLLTIVTLKVLIQSFEMSV